MIINLVAVYATITTSSNMEFYNNSIFKDIIDHVQYVFLNILAKIKSPIILVIDKDLEAFMNILMCYKVSEFKKNYNIASIYILGTKFTNEKFLEVVIITRNNIKSCDMLASIIEHSLCHTIFVPKYDLRLDRLLEMEGMHGKTKVYDLPELCLLPVDNDILSMALSSKDNVNLYTDNYIFYNICNAINMLSTFREVIGVGDTAKKVMTFMQKATTKSNNNFFDKLVIINRKYFMDGPLLVPTTFGGLCSKYLSDKVTDDNMFNRIKYSQCDKANAIVKELLESYTVNKTDNGDKLKRAIANLKIYPKDSVTRHLNNLENILKNYKGMFDIDMKIEAAILDGKNYTDLINNMIDKQEPLDKVLAYIILSSLHGIVNLKDFELSILRVYGYKHILTFKNMYDYGLVKENKLEDRVMNFVPDLDDHPKTLNELLKDLSKPKTKQKFYKINNKIDKTNNNTLVFVIGGLTMDEIAEIKSSHKEIYLATTSIIDSKSFIEGFFY